MWPVPGWLLTAAIRHLTTLTDNSLSTELGPLSMAVNSPGMSQHPGIFSKTPLRDPRHIESPDPPMARGSRSGGIFCP